MRCPKRKRLFDVFVHSLATALLCALCCASPARSAALSAEFAKQIDEIELQARGDAKLALARVEGLLKSARTSDETLALLTLKGLFLADSDRPEEAREVATELDRQSSPEAKAASLTVRAQVQGLKGDLGRALEFAKQAAESLPRDADVRQHYRIEMIRGSQLLENGRLPEALSAYQAALEGAESIQSTFRIQRAHDSMASLFVDAHELDKATEANNTAMALAERLGDPAILAQAWNTRAYIASAQQNRALELQASQKAIAYARKTASDSLLSGMLMNLGDTFLKAGRYADALRYSDEAVAITRRISDPHGLAIALANAGQAEIRLGRVDAGKAHMEEAIAATQKLDHRSQHATLLSEYGEALEAAGDYKGAINAYHRERRASREIAELSRKDVLLEVDARYQSDRKQREIELLNRNNALKDAQLHNRELQQRVWFLAAALLLSGLLSIGLLYRRVRDANLKLAESNRLLKVRSERDPLTGLFNRRYFHEAMRARGANNAFAGGLILLDIDHFKRINDTHGHAAGDAVITVVAQRLIDTMRDSDLVVRWGGEEFLIAVSPMPLEQFDRLAERLLRAIGHAPVPHGDLSIPITISIGYASFPLAPSGLALEWERGINQVDMALYVAKAQGRNRACGIRAVQAADKDALDEIEHNFENAWRDGRVTLNLISGPSPP
ncbi:hypothetical protein GCM10025771_25940 [Niveibacterium umoris]|uniref:diguanylate cyclase n=1 Tax=Niveibacterium umoris TaxID=1193620 RepID=A0A840BP39_9RHOO|nr:tetratricopeptide repeat-containing diguanylate cyclase [Niveibacterium umoris]MBB4012217.1 diguanylate cyclase (GGDEF)-like protein [Niveibacterium umoris]